MYVYWILHNTHTYKKQSVHYLIPGQRLRYLESYLVKTGWVLLKECATLKTVKSHKDDG